jgi:hypothetical protein
MEFDQIIEFNLIKFREYVKTNMKLHYDKSDEIILNSVCQFEKYPYEIADISANSYKEKIRNRFKLTGKPISVSWNDWLLYSYGFWNCNNCHKVKSLNEFYPHNTRWNKIRTECKKCSCTNKEFLRERTPKWLTQLDIENIDRIYSTSSRKTIITKVQHHVDHLIPLRGDFVSGLHILSNLTIVTEAENLQKTNKFDQEYWSNKCFTELKEIGL